MEGKPNKLKILWTLFITFLKLGAITFGGGYVMLALIRDEFAERKKWVTDDELLKVFAVAESTPGPVAINAATYIGGKMCGFIGALVATIAVIIPAFIVSFVIAVYLNSVMKYDLVVYALKGIKAGVSVLILFAGIDMLKKMEKTVFSVIACILSLAAMLLIDIFSVDFSSIYIILIFGAASLFIYAVTRKKCKDIRGIGDEKDANLHSQNTLNASGEINNSSSGNIDKNGDIPLTEYATAKISEALLDNKKTETYRKESSIGENTAVRGGATYKKSLENSKINEKTIKENCDRAGKGDKE